MDSFSSELEMSSLGTRSSGDDTSLLTLLGGIIKNKKPTSYPSGLESEGDALHVFCQLYHEERKFSSLQESSSLEELLAFLKCHRLTEDWLLGGDIQGGAGHIHSALMSVRLLLRDEQFQHHLMGGANPTPVLVQALARYIQLHFSSQQSITTTTTITSTTTTTDQLKELTNIFQKLSNCERYRQQLVDDGVHYLMVQLLWSHDLVPLQCALCALINLCKTESVSVCVASLECATPLIHIISSYDTVSRHLASDLLLLLSQHSNLKEQIRDSDTLPACLRVLHSDDPHLLHRMVGVVERLAESSDYQEELRLLGGIPLILGLLSKHVITESQSRDVQDKVTALRAICCSTLTQLVLNDTNAQLIVQSNGVYLVATNILPVMVCGADEDGGGSQTRLDHSRLRENLQRYALRALRYLFSMERNRRIFKKLLPPNIFALFIDVGHYTRPLSAYTALVQVINSLPESERAVMLSNIESINQLRAPIFSVGGYAVLELLGAGAFGSVYKVRKQNSDVFLALKEIRSTHPALGHTLTEQSTSIGQLLNEVNIVREQLRHSNVVRYHKCFQENGHLYIVMELLEGASLGEHISSLGEKGLRFSEERLWRIFMQLTLALRYIHKEKNITHRDLSPANLMLGEGDKLTITDFGLAKQKQREFSVMKSVVGTISYSCPELIEGRVYNEKADIWAAGCILYQMAELLPPFQSTNLLALAKKIAEVDYLPIPKHHYSPLVGEVVEACLTFDPQVRPDSVQLGSMLTRVLMREMDSLSLAAETMERRLTKEKQRTVRHYNKAMWSERRYQQLLSSSDASIPSQARRKLSSTFSGPHPPNQTLLSQQNSTTLLETPGETEEPRPQVEPHSQTDPLRCSNDSVFSDYMQYRLPSNCDQPASPQISRGGGRPNPLTSRPHPFTTYPSATRFRTQSSGERPGHTHLGGWGAGPQSPLATEQKSRTPSASSVLSISPKHLREISNPILIMLTQLHKLVSLTQLPPSPTPSARWTLIQYYKRHLFSMREGSAQALKKEMTQLVSGGGAGETLPGGMEEEDEGSGMSRTVQRALAEMREEGVAYLDHGYMTYEMLQQIIESLAREHGYYEHH